MISKSGNRLIVHNTFILYVRMFVVMLIQFYTTRVILNSLGVTDFGIYGVVGGIVVICNSIVGSLGSATSRFIMVELGRPNSERLNLVFWTAIVLHILIATGLSILCETVGMWFLHTQMTIPADRLFAAEWVLHFSVLSVMFSILQVPYVAVIIGNENMNVYAYGGMLEAFGTLVIAFIIDCNPVDRLIWYSLLLMGLKIIITIYYRAYCLRNYIKEQFQMPHDKALYREIMSYSLYDLIGNLSIMAQGQGLNMVLNVYCGPIVNAAYNITEKTRNASMTFANNFLTAIKPQIISHYVIHDVPGMMRLVRNGSILSYMLIFLVIPPLCFDIDAVLKLWLGAYPPYTSQFVIISMFCVLLNSFRAPRITAFHATGHIRLSNLITGGILCSALPIGYLLMRYHSDPVSVFWVMLGTVFIADITNLLILKRYINYSISDFLRKVHLKCALISSITMPIVYCLTLWMNPGLIRFIACLFVSGIIIAVCTWFLVLEQSHRGKIISAVNQMRIWNIIH